MIELTLSISPFFAASSSAGSPLNRSARSLLGSFTRSIGVKLSLFLLWALAPFYI